MTDVRFYHLVSKRLEQALPEILQKALERGHRIVLRAGSKERLEALDAILWTYDANSFLPHGRLKDGFEKDQPVWMTTGDDNPNGADVLVLIDRAGAEKMGDYALCCDMFDGNDPESVAAARDRWKSFKEQGFGVTYYQQDEQGRWVQK